MSRASQIIPPARLEQDNKVGFGHRVRGYIKQTSNRLSNSTTKSMDSFPRPAESQLPHSNTTIGLYGTVLQCSKTGCIN